MCWQAYVAAFVFFPFPVPLGAAAVAAFVAFFFFAAVFAAGATPFAFFRGARVGANL